jgi:hypothetical protein
MSNVRKTRNFFFALLDNNNGENSKIRTDNATTNRLAFTFTSTTGTIARVAFGEEEANTSRMKNTLE